jgi:hypothetical protein
VGTWSQLFELVGAPMRAHLARMERLRMRKVREVLCLRFECGRTERQISASCGISAGSISDFLARAEAAPLSWEEASALTDAEVETRLFRLVGRNEPPKRTAIDFAWVHRELCKVAVTLQLLWIEYTDAARAGTDGSRPYQYSQFCDHYAAWKATLALSMRQVHRAGETTDGTPVRHQSIIRPRRSRVRLSGACLAHCLLQIFFVPKSLVSALAPVLLCVGLCWSCSQTETLQSTTAGQIDCSRESTVITNVQRNGTRPQSWDATCLDRQWKCIRDWSGNVSCAPTSRTQDPAVVDGGDD